MKKTLVAICALLVGVSAYAQGTVTIANAGAGFNQPIYVGTVGGTLADNTTMVEVWAGPDAANLALVGSAFNVAINGLFSNGTQALGNVAPGATATMLVRAWQGGASYDTATINKGESLSFTALTGGVGSPASPPGNMANFQSFAIIPVPEPSVIMLGVAGAGLLWLRRKK
jgi:hypothetical protein